MAEITREKAKANMNSNSRVIAVILAVATLLVTFRLAELQIVHHDVYSRNATNAQWSEEIIPAIRGTIYDANGTVLAQSAQTWQLYLIPEEFKNEEFRKQVCKDVAQAFELDFDELMELTYTVPTSGDDDELVVAHKKVVKKQMEYAEKLLVDCGEDADPKLEKNEKAKWSSTEYGEVKVTDCLMHRSFRCMVDGEEKVFSYKKIMGLDTDSKRYYPMGEFASSVLGFVNDEQNGVAGIERYYNSLLSGTDGRITSYGTNIDEDNGNVYEASDGVNLRLTIDETVQYNLTKNLKDVLENCGGLGAYGIVMNVNTGAILGMESVGYKGKYDASNPQKLNDYYKTTLKTATDAEDYSYLEKYYTEDEWEKEQEKIDGIKDFKERCAYHSKKLNNYFMNEQWNNYIVSETYHPGSVFKIFLTAAAIEENILPADYRYNCDGSVQIDDRTFHCHSSYHYDQDLRTGLMNSCNPFFVTLGQKLGKEKFYQYFEAFGFTEKTGIESLEESNSIYFTADNMSRVNLASESFGQTFSITPIQMITAISAIANGGYLMQPYLVDAQLDADGNVISKTEPTVKRQVISEETAAEVASMMEDVVKSGTGRNGKVAGYRVAGKTGTTQKYQLKGTYIASFGCFAPADDPEIAVLIIVDEPQTEMNGSIVCAPVASKVVESTLEYLGVERQYTEDELKELDVTIPNVIGSDAEDARSVLKEAGFTVRVVGEGDTVAFQNPLGGQSIPKNGVVAVYTSESDEKSKVVVPDFSGMSAQGVKELAVSEGINVKVSGNIDKGICFEQEEEAGTEVEYGSIIKVYFKTYSNVGDSTGE